MEYLYFAFWSAVGIGITYLILEGYSRVRNKELHEEITRLKTENEIFSINTVNDGLEISKPGKDKADLKKEIANLTKECNWLRQANQEIVKAEDFEYELKRAGGVI